jgi:hypothetical protein
MKTFKINYELRKRGYLLVKAESKEDAPNQLMKYSLDEIIEACDEGTGPFFCEDCDIVEMKIN